MLGERRQCAAPEKMLIPRNSLCGRLAAGWYRLPLRLKIIKSRPSLGNFTIKTSPQRAAARRKDCSAIVFNFNYKNTRSACEAPKGNERHYLISLHSRSETWIFQQSRVKQFFFYSFIKRLFWGMPDRDSVLLLTFHLFHAPEVRRIVWIDWISLL